MGPQGGISALRRAGSCLLLVLWGHRERLAVHNPGSVSSLLPASRTVRNQCQLGKAPSLWHFVNGSLSGLSHSLWKNVYPRLIPLPAFPRPTLDWTVERILTFLSDRGQNLFVLVLAFLAGMVLFPVNPRCTLARLRAISNVMQLPTCGS